VCGCPNAATLTLVATALRLGGSPSACEGHLLLSRWIEAQHDDVDMCITARGGPQGRRPHHTVMGWPRLPDISLRPQAQFCRDTTLQRPSAAHSESKSGRGGSEKVMTQQNRRLESTIATSLFLSLSLYLALSFSLSLSLSLLFRSLALSLSLSLSLSIFPSLALHTLPLFYSSLRCLLFHLPFSNSLLTMLLLSLALRAFITLNSMATSR